jgi:hypothetical protein
VSYKRGAELISVLKRGAGELGVLQGRSRRAWYLIREEQESSVSYKEDAEELSVLQGRSRKAWCLTREEQKRLVSYKGEAGEHGVL